MFDGLTCAEAQDALKGMLHGNTLDQISNITTIARRAGSNILSKIDPEETRRSALIANALHTDAFTYTIPVDIKGKKVIDIYPQVQRSDGERFGGVATPAHFDLRKELSSGRTKFHIYYKNGLKQLKISKNIDPAATSIHNMDSLTGNGTWAGVVDGGNLTQDKQNKAQGSASVNFDLNGSATTGGIENSTFSKVDLSDHEDISIIFVWVFLPDASKITNVALRWGSTASAHWEVTATSPHDSSAFADGWNFIAFDWNGATETGSPSAAAIDYLRVLLTYDGTADTDFRVDGIFSSIGELHNIDYYSHFFFRTSANVFKETPSDDSDIINIGPEGENIFLYEMLAEMAQEIQGEDSANDIAHAVARLGEQGSPSALYAEYIRNNPSLAIRSVRKYYERR